MQEFNFLFYDGQLVFRVLLGLTVVIVSLVVEYVSLQLMLRVFNLLSFLFVLLVLLKLVKFVAFVIAARCRPMLLP